MPKVKIFIEKVNEYKEVDASTVKEAAEKLNVNLTTVIAVKNNELVTEEEKIDESDSIRFLSVISGG